MTDKEFIIFLCEEIRDICCDGDEPDLATIEEELKARELDIDEIFTY